jgi:hypothetical protein
VDVNGCEIYSLPSDNFSVKSIGESCISSDNGSIEVMAAEALNYSGTLTGASGATSLDFSSMATFPNLVAGAYTLCITVEGQPDYESCFDLTIIEPEALSVASKVSTLKGEVTLGLTGGKEYTIAVNDKVYKTIEKEITLPLDQVQNKISVKTDKDCQGTYEETIVLNSNAIIYPNPISYGELGIYLGMKASKKVQLTLYTLNGVEVFTKSYGTVDGDLKINVDSLPKGMYILNVKTDESLLNYKIIKQ